MYCSSWPLFVGLECSPIVLRFINCNAFGNILAAKLINQVSLNQKWDIEFEAQVFKRHWAKKFKYSSLVIWKCLEYMKTVNPTGARWLPNCPPSQYDKILASKLKRFECDLQKLSYKIPNPPVTFLLYNWIFYHQFPPKNDWCRAAVWRA